MIPLPPPPLGPQQPQPWQPPWTVLEKEMDSDEVCWVLCHPAGSSLRADQCYQEPLCEACRISRRRKRVLGSWRPGCVFRASPSIHRRWVGLLQHHCDLHLLATPGRPTHILMRTNPSLFLSRKDHNVLQGPLTIFRVANKISLSVFPLRQRTISAELEVGQLIDSAIFCNPDQQFSFNKCNKKQVLLQ